MHLISSNPACLKVEQQKIKKLRYEVDIKCYTKSQLSKYADLPVSQTTNTKPP